MGKNRESLCFRMNLEEIEKNKVAFKEDLHKLSHEDVIRKYITSGECALLDHSRYFELRKVVSEKFSARHEEILVVGSGKLGFSIAPNKRFRNFQDTSDIDVSIVSPKLFDEVWLKILKFDSDGEFAMWDEKRAFLKYLYKGWIRPDLLPSSGKFTLSVEWWDFFRELTSSGKYCEYKISGSLYRSHDYLELYQARCVKECKSTVGGGI